jgi:hypothetical protein
LLSSADRWQSASTAARNCHLSEAGAANLDLREGHVKDGPIGPLDRRLTQGSISLIPHGLYRVAQREEALFD